MFSIAPYKLWFCCMLHDVTVDIFFGNAFAWKESILELLDTVKAAPHDCLISLF